MFNLSFYFCTRSCDFCKVMASVISSVCYPQPITFIFFFYNVTTTLLYIICIFGWWWYSACPVILVMGCVVISVTTIDSKSPCFLFFHYTQRLNELYRQKKVLRKWLLSDKLLNGLVWNTAGTRRCNNVRFWFHFGRNVG